MCGKAPQTCLFEAGLAGRCQRGHQHEHQRWLWHDRSGAEIPDETAGPYPADGGLSWVSLGSDNVFGNDGGVLQLGTATGTVASGYAVSPAVRLDTGTTPAAGGCLSQP